MSKRLSLVTREMEELAQLAQLAFEWPIRQAPRLMLPLCILAAAIVQTVMMVLFSISYRSPADKTPEAPQFYFLPPESEAARQLAPWLEANDPAVFSPIRTARTASPALPPLQYRPSYEEPPPDLRPLRKDPNAAIQPPLPPATVPLQRSAPFESKTLASVPTGGAVAHLPTVVRWEDGLANRQGEDAGFSSAPVASSAATQPALYEVGVGPEGMPLHCVLVESSGDPMSDETGRIWIMARRFKPADMMTWGRVRMLWCAHDSKP